MWLQFWMRVWGFRVYEMEGCELQVTGDLELAVETSTLIKPSLGLQPSALNMATAQAETPAMGFAAP